MADKAVFWKGVSAGFFAGMTVAAALRYTPLEKLLSRAPETAGDPALASGDVADAALRALPAPAQSALGDFFSRRDQPESAGDPATLASARTGAVASFLRTGGAAGGRHAAEVLEVPGRPGERIEPAKPLRSYPRSLDLGSSG